MWLRGWYREARDPSPKLPGSLTVASWTSLVRPPPLVEAVLRSGVELLSRGGVGGGWGRVSVKERK